jgi:hypothetical protein
MVNCSNVIAAIHPENETGNKNCMHSYQGMMVTWGDFGSSQHHHFKLSGGKGLKPDEPSLREVDAMH